LILDVADFSFSQGCQIFLGTTYQNGKNIPNNQIIYQMAEIQTKWSENIPTSSIASPSKIYSNKDFWFENMPSGNPGFILNLNLPLFQMLILVSEMLLLRHTVDIQITDRQNVDKNDRKFLHHLTLPDCPQRCYEPIKGVK
jgi:hypothetical protein